MARLTHKNAFTLIELVVVVAIVGLAIATVGPGLANLGQKRRTASCLSNLRQIAAASWQYAAEDPREQLVPLHQTNVRLFHYAGFPDREWSWLTAIPRSFGGRTATAPFPMDNGVATVMQDDSGHWAARTRPLNRLFLTPASRRLELFHCPAVAGYPDSAWTYLDAPDECVGIPCYDFLGNSYRFNGIGLVWTGTGMSAKGFFTSAPWGHTASSLASALDDIVLYCDPLFYNFARCGEGSDYADPIPDWHGELMSDNVAYCDGSARLTRVGELYEFSDEELDEMNYADPAGGHDWTWFLRRGPTWRLDTYPTPGAQIRMYTSSGMNVTPDVSPSLLEFWPWHDYQYNPPPE
jgi:prepilin-type N-terminal cleavage/methylation domain-containing protein